MKTPNRTLNRSAQERRSWVPARLALAFDGMVNLIARVPVGALCFALYPMSGTLVSSNDLGSSPFRCKLLGRSALSSSATRSHKE